MTNQKKIGLRGEEVAANFLEKKGYKILYRNWSFLHKEIDIIAEYNNELIIVEVKTRKADSLISPLEAVNLRKQRFIIDAANTFIQQHDVNLEVRFDIITVVYGYNLEIEHIENAFYPKVR
jgi:putative endonuclease